MAAVFLLEAYYGGSVVLDYQDDEGRNQALDLALLTVERMEADRPSGYAMRLESDGEGAWQETSSRDAVRSALEQYVTPANRYNRVLLRIGDGPPYAFGVLSEDGSCVDVAPAWQASHAWYDRFWATLWKAGMEMEASDPNFHLRTPSGERDSRE